MPKVSVISTVYNGEQHFNKALPSILAQSYSDFEYIIVNDGSSDNTLALLNKEAENDSRVRVIDAGRVGRSRALNLAVEHAQGEFIIQQDFDDVSYSNRISEQIKYFENNSQVGVVGAFYKLIDENREEYYIRKPPERHADLVLAMARYIPIAHTIAAFRKKAWADAGGYPSVDDIEDLHLWISMVKCGWRAENIPLVLGEHFVYSQSYWHKSFRYKDRQKKLMMAQIRAIKDLKLPVYCYIYPVGRTIYGLLPNTAKRLIRRVVGRSKEADVTHL